MIYIFGLLILYTLYSQREKLLAQKRNLVIFIILSAIGITLGVIHMIRPYDYSLAYIIESYIN